MTRISSKHRITIPTAALHAAALHPGDDVIVEALGRGELRIRRGALTFERAFGTLSGVYPERYLERIDSDDQGR